MIGTFLGPYRILAKLGQGGMGEVYRAIDSKLDREVAIKVLPESFARDGARVARFRREARALASLNHPNIATIHGVEEQGETWALVMELVDGEDLSQVIARGPLAPAHALPIATQLADALDAAHDRGIVHRDLKPANVKLKAGGAVKVLDFGLAKAIDLESGIGSMSTANTATTPATTEAGMVLGTPEYMAPEQVEGGEVTPATDVYAFGLVLYEMVTGRRPFAAATPLAAAARRLAEGPRSPRELVPNLDLSWESAILRCLARRPEDRFPRAGEVVTALGAVTPRRGARPHIRGLAIGTLLILLAGVSITVWNGRWRSASGDSTAADLRSNPRRSVAVLGFKNTAGRPDAAWLSAAFSEMLTTELAAGESLRTIPGENVARMKIELALADADMYGPDTLSRIGNSLGTDLVVFGSYVTVGEPGTAAVRLDARLQDARAGQTIALVSETSADGNILDLVSRIGGRLRERLNFEALPPAVTASVLASQPANLEAIRLYAEGLSHLRRFDALAARDRLERAVAADVRFPLSHAALAMAWSTLGYDERARSTARKAFELSSGLSREERLSVEAFYRQTVREWTQAIEIYQTLFRFFPDNLEYGLRLADAQITSGAAKEALATVDAIRASGRTTDPRVDLAEAAAADTVSDFKRMRAAASAAAERARSQGSRLIVARANLLAGTATLRLGEPDQAVALYEEARRTFAEAGDQGSLARALNHQATILADHGDARRAEQLYAEALAIARAIGQQQMVASLLNNLAVQKRRAGDVEGSLGLNRDALAIRREIGDRINVAVSLNNIGNVLLDLGNLTGAVRHFEEAAGIHRALGDRRGLARAKNNAGVALKSQGDIAGARLALEEALTIRRDIADPASVANSLYNIGEVLAVQGDLTNAARHFDEALAIQRKLSQGRGVGYSLFGLGDVALAQGNTALARKQMEESFEVRTRLGEKATAAESQTGLAHIALAEGRIDDATRLARQALGVIVGQNTPDSEARARIALAAAMAAAGQFDRAQAEADRARALVGSAPNVLAKLAVAIVAARIQAQARPSEARTAAAALQDAEAEATRLGLVSLRLDAALARAELARQSDRDDGEHRLAALEKEARTLGFGLVAARARQVRAAAK